MDSRWLHSQESNHKDVKYSLENNSEQEYIICACPFHIEQLHLHCDKHFLQSETLGYPPSQLHFLTHCFWDISLSHKHCAMHRMIGAHAGQSDFIRLAMQSLHSLPSAGQARAGKLIISDIMRNVTKNAIKFFSFSKFIVWHCFSCLPGYLYMDTGKLMILIIVVGKHTIPTNDSYGFIFINSLTDCYWMSYSSSGDLAVHWYAQHLIF